MARDKDSPLTTADKSNINAALVKLNQLLADIEFAESVGQPTDEYRARHAHLMQTLEAFRKNYFSGTA